MNTDHFRNGFPCGFPTFMQTFTIWWSHNWDETHHGNAILSAPQAVIMLKNERDVLPLSSKVRSSKNSTVRGNCPRELPVLFASKTS